MSFKYIFISVAFCFCSLFFIQVIKAQRPSPELIQAITQAEEKLNSEDIQERIAVLDKLVIYERDSHVRKTILPFNLSANDYAYVISKIFEKDLTRIDAKEASQVFSKAGFLIVKFSLKEFAKNLADYISKFIPQGNQYYPNIEIQYTILRTIRALKAKEFAPQIASLLNPQIAKTMRQEALSTLIDLQAKEAVPSLISLLYEKNYSQRFYAIESLVKVNGKEAAPHIAKLLNDENSNNRYWALDALVKLNARGQSPKIWQLINSGQTEQTEMYAITALVYFEDPNAVRIAAKLISEGSEKGRGLLERFAELQAKAIIPALINILEKEIFSPESGFKDHVSIIHCLQKLEAKEAAPLLRKYIKLGRFGSATAINVLGDFRDKEAVDEILEVFYKYLRNPPNRFTNDATAFAEAALALAKIGDKRVWKDLIDVVVNPLYPYRSQIIIELNKHINPKLWQKAQEKKLLYQQQQRGQIFSLKELIGIYSNETDIPIILYFEPGKDVAKRKPLASPYKDTKGYPWTYIRYNIPLIEGLREIPMTISDGTYPQNFTFIFDNQEIHILTVEKAVDWWRKNILTK